MSFFNEVGFFDKGAALPYNHIGTRSQKTNERGSRMLINCFVVFTLVVPKEENQEFRRAVEGASPLWGDFVASLRTKGYRVMINHHAVPGTAIPTDVMVASTVHCDNDDGVVDYAAIRTRVEGDFLVFAHKHGLEFSSRAFYEEVGDESRGASDHLEEALTFFFGEAVGEAKKNLLEKKIPAYGMIDGQLIKVEPVEEVS